MNPDKLKDLQIDEGYKRRPQTSIWMIFLVVGGLTGAAVYFAWPRAEDTRRVVDTHKNSTDKTEVASTSSTPAVATKPRAPAKPGDSVLTVSGYIINRERIELSPRFMGVVNWIGVKKGDTVTNGQVVVLLDNAEYKARLHEAEGRLAGAKVNVAKADLDYQRAKQLVSQKVEMQKLEDDARLALDGTRAAVREVEGQVELIKTYLDWTIIKSPINGVVLEKLVDPNELVVPQSFGGPRGPSTALIALADPKDLQVEIDVNEADLPKVFLGQKCRVTPEAYPDKVYDGVVAEIAPEASREKGTLQIKVQIKEPDKYLTPQLSAKVVFLGTVPAKNE